MFDLKPPRHTSTLHEAALRLFDGAFRS
jgi:hypothetical protein